MSPRRNLTPSYLPHKQSGRGRLVWTDHTGNRQQKLLSGAFWPPESLAAKARLELEVVTSPAAVAARASTDGISVAEVPVAFMTHAERYYRDPDGKPGSELVSIKPVSGRHAPFHRRRATAQCEPSGLRLGRRCPHRGQPQPAPEHANILPRAP